MSVEERASEVVSVVLWGTKRYSDRKTARRLVSALKAEGLLKEDR